jgi:uncharacterized protein YecE (DUF72 family)
MAAPGTVRIGVSGWRYAPWRGAFYPKGLAQRRELAYMGEQFATNEINGTFYSLQRPTSFAQWAGDVPSGFQFSVKGPRFITHILRLKDAETPLANFFASGVLLLGPKLGPFLWQLPPSFRFDADRIAGFLRQLPRDFAEAAALAGRHDSHIAGRAVTEAPSAGKLRHAMEIRHESFATPEFIELLRREGVALVCADSVQWPRLMDVTADFVYCRLHGSEEIYASGYDDTAIAEWAARVKAWAGGGEPADAQRVIDTPGPKRARRDVYVYFDNDAKVRAPSDARSLNARVAPERGRRLAS